MMLMHLWNDSRYAARRLGRSPGFTAAAVLTIGLGVGINTGIFSVLNGLALRELPAPTANDLVNVHQVVEGDDSRLSEGVPSMFSTAEYRTYRERARTLTGILGYSMKLDARLGETRQRVSGIFVTCDYFAVLQQPPALGPGFGAQSCEPGAAPTIVLGHDVWTSAYGADPGIIGRDVLVNRQSFTVVGVAAEGVRGLDFLPVSWFAPVATLPVLFPGFDWYNDERMSWLRLIGRKRDDTSVDQVRAELRVIAAEIDAQKPPRETTLVVDRARRFSEPQLRGALVTVGGVVMTAFGLVLLIACANVANLLLARATGRSREIAVRLSLGASRTRVVQSLLAESMLLAAAGGLLGSVLAIWSFQGLVAFVLSALPFNASQLMIDTAPDGRVLTFAFVVALATGIVCGLAPALQVTRPELHTAMKLDSLGTGHRIGSRLQGTLVGVQVAVCMVLMIAAGLLLRGLHAAQTVDPGFSYENVAVASFEWGDGYDAERVVAAQRQLMERIGSLPGIAAVAQVARTPLSPTISTLEARVPGQDERFQAGKNTVSPSYFSLIGIPIVRGRTFTGAELVEGSTAVIVTEATARRLWPGQDPIGQALIVTASDVRTGESLPDRTHEVVGIAKDAEISAIGEIPSAYLYLPLPRNQAGLFSLAKGRVDFAATAAAIRAAAAEVDPAVVVSVEPLEANLDLWRSLSTLVGTLSTSLGALALVIASVGVYGVVAYAVGRRVREIGIRIALGASARSVVTLVLKGTMRPVVIGAVIGIAAAAAVSRVLSSVLFGVSPADPVALVGAALVVGCVALAAGILPARRATRVDPMKTLHYE